MCRHLNANKAKSGKLRIRNGKLANVNELKKREHSCIIYTDTNGMDSSVDAEYQNSKGASFVDVINCGDSSDRESMIEDGVYEFGYEEDGLKVNLIK